ncbi:S41 family peptidase [Algibacter sp. 2305UL17-15]|uniref:S41 family peptidase n=1 Tax=Algibacter sp. 2305UL17-15 TaxID=3231268 RepID=UPI0034599B7F
MKKLNALVLIAAALFLTSCFEDGDDNTIQRISINDFVWKGMNYGYLYKSEIPNLADDRFVNTSEYSEYLDGFSSPEALFESLIYQRQTVDRFSWIVDNYFVLEQNFEGTSKTTGMERILFRAPNSSNLIGVVRLVLPNTDADIKGVKRGDIFYAVNGTEITEANAFNLLNQDEYTINLGVFNDKGTPETTDDSIDPTGENITLTKFEYTENPIFISDILEVQDEKVGYLMYNGFIGDSENALNPIFGQFKSNNIQHLVLDLRYNPGGSVPTTTALASMITGQFTGQVFEKLIYNDNLQSQNTDYVFANNLNGGALNSLGLNKIYVLTSRSSASASEGIINGLKPYIDVVQIGTNTRGKTQASRTFYDSPNFTRQGANPAHTYAMQPLVAIGLNKNNETVPSTGLVPSIGFEYQERAFNLGVLGNENEPMLALALADIASSTTKMSKIKSESGLQRQFELVVDENDFNPREGGMIID